MSDGLLGLCFRFETDARRRGAVAGPAAVRVRSNVATTAAQVGPQREAPGMYEIVVIGEREEPPGEAAGDVPLRAEGGPPLIPPTKSGDSAVILRRTFAAGSLPSSPADTAAPFTPDAP